MAFPIKEEVQIMTPGGLMIFVPKAEMKTTDEALTTSALGRTQGREKLGDRGKQIISV